jgi:hypothetical protein
MTVSRSRLSRFLADSHPQCDPAFHPVSNFYREEFAKCQRCLEQQREFYSHDTITDVERALTKVSSIGCLPRLTPIKSSASFLDSSTSSQAFRPGPIPDTLTDPFRSTPP